MNHPLGADFSDHIFWHKVHKPSFRNNQYVGHRAKLSYSISCSGLSDGHACHGVAFVGRSQFHCHLYLLTVTAQTSINPVQFREMLA